MQRLQIQGRANGTTQHFHQSLNDDDQKFDFSQELSVTKFFLNKFAKTEKMDFFARQQKKRIDRNLSTAASATTSCKKTLVTLFLRE